MLSSDRYCGEWPFRGIVVKSAIEPYRPIRRNRSFASKGGQIAAFSTMSAAFSPIMIDGALVLPDVSLGMIEASATRRPAMPWTRSWVRGDTALPEMTALYDHIRAATVVKREVPVATGEIDPAFTAAARVVEAEYEWPFQSHASMGPACAVVRCARRRGNVMDRLAEAVPEPVYSPSIR